MLETVSFKVDSDNDIYQITINNQTYSVDGINYPSVYETQYRKLFDELNHAIEII